MFDDPDNQIDSKHIYIIPLICGVMILGITVFLAFHVKEQQAKFLKETLNEESKRASLYIVDSIESSINALRRMVSRWEAEGGTPKERWVLDAQNYVRDSVALTAVEWADNTYHIRWIEPLAGNEKAMGLNIKFNEERKKALEGAAQSGAITMTPPFVLVQGYKAVISYLPIYKNNGFDGFIIGIYDLDAFLSKILQARNNNVFEYKITDKAEIVHSTNDNENGKIEGWSVSSEMSLYNRNWSMTISFDEEYLEEVSTNLDLAVFITGAALAVLFSIALHNALLVNIRNNELDKARDEAIKANDAKSSFLAGMSHEIRTPMNGVLGTARLLSETQLSKKQKKYLKVISESGENLLEIINEVLDFSKIEAGKLEIHEEVFEFKDAIEQQSILLQPLAQEKGIEYSLEFSNSVPEYIIGDKLRIKQVLGNLIGNAIKFTDSGKIEITVDVVEKDWKSFIRLSVKDTGIGIAHESHGRVFVAFEQIVQDRKTVKTAGTGLGLSISKRLVEMMGGEINFESEQNQGAIFWFDFPMKIPSEVMLKEVEMREAQQKGSSEYQYKVLIVEDVLTNQFVISEMLKGLGCEFDIANNGQEAFEAVQKHKYDVVLMDCNMPVMDGYEATKKIRELGIDKLPIIALTASALESDKKKCLSAGMNDFVSKPIDKNEIVRIMDEIAA